jgi:type III restriction enzyme
VPIADNQTATGGPLCRHLWYAIRDKLPKKGRFATVVSGEPKLPEELQWALFSLYGNYEKCFRWWEDSAEARARGLMTPVFIVVCNNTSVSKIVYDYIAGWEKQVGDSTIV